MSQKTAKKTATVTPAHGRGALLPGGQVGNKGGGRLPDAFKARMRALLDRESVDVYLQECLTGQHGESAYFKALEFAAERGEGKVPQVTKVVGDDAEPLVIKVVKG